MEKSTSGLPSGKNTTTGAECKRVKYHEAHIMHDVLQKVDMEMAKLKTKGSTEIDERHTEKHAIPSYSPTTLTVKYAQ